MRECKTPGATYSFNPANNYQDDGWRLHVTVNYPTGKLGGLNNDMFGSRSPHGLYRDIVHDAMEWATAEIHRLNAIYCERTDCLPRHPDYEAQRSAAVAEIEHERRPFPPDLRAQGEPVAWAWERLDERRVWRPRVSVSEPGEHSWHRNIRPLYEAPAAPRTGSGVSVEEIARTIAAKVFRSGVPAGALGKQINEAAEAILALFAQAPRDGGETQGGWQPIETAPKDETRFWALQIDRDPDEQQFVCWWQPDFLNWTGWCDNWGTEPDPTHWRPLPTPPSGVETIRQDTSGGL